MEIMNVSNGEWTRVHSGTWNHTGADVLCRQLGYQGALSAYGVQLASPSPMLSVVECTGGEESLCECLSNERAQGTEARVVCQSKLLVM